MNSKRFWIAFVVVFVILEATSYLIHGVILGPTYESEGIKEVFRSAEEMSANMWIMWVTDIIWAFFFTFIFVKGYENKGIMEGIKYGIYMGIFFSLVIAYQNYTVLPIPYSLALQWFIYGLIQCIILGIVAAAIYKPKEVAGTSES